MLVEVDGDSFHTESPAEADRRTRMFKVGGAYIERVKASECDTPEKAEGTAKRILMAFEWWRATRVTRGRGRRDPCDILSLRSVREQGTVGASRCSEGRA